MRRHRSAGQALVETVIVLVTIPAMMIMFNSMFYFSEGISSKIRLTNFARYAAIKEARNERINPIGVMDVRGARIPSYRIRENSTPATIAAVVNALTFIIAPLTAGQFPLILPMIPAIILPLGSNQIEVTAAYVHLPSPVNARLGARVLTSKATIDAKTWTTGRGMANENPLGLWWTFLWRLMYQLQDWLFVRGAAINGLSFPPLGPIDHSIWGMAIPDASPVAPMTEFLSSIFTLTIISGLMNWLAYLIP